MPLVFVSASRYVSEYVDSYGDTVYIPRRTPSIGWSLDDALYLMSVMEWDLEELKSHMSGILKGRVQYRADALEQCEDCDDITDDTTTVDRGYRVVCESCRDNSYSHCDGCEEWLGQDDVAYFDGADVDYCDSCRQDLYYCNSCDTYSHDGCEDCRYCDCSTPRTSFSALGQTHDERFTVDMPAGSLSDEGRSEIRTYLYRLSREAGSLAGSSATYGAVADSYVIAASDRATTLLHASQVANELDPAAGTGSFAKALRREVYKALKVELPADVVSHVGNLFSKHSRPVTVGLDITRRFDEGASYFGNESSCWYGGHNSDYGQSLCWAKDGYLFGLRAVGERSDWDVRGRVWVLPVTVTTSVFPGGPATVNGEDVVTTHVDGSTWDDANAWVVFNGYGELAGMTGPRVVAQMTGMSYKRIDFSTSGNVYVNPGSASLVAPADLLATVDSVDVDTYI